MSRTVYALLEDLLFSSKLDLAAKGLGVALKVFSSREALRDGVQGQRPDLVIVDLNAEHLEPMETLKDLAGGDVSPPVPTVGYCSHVDLPVMRAAEASGCGQVLARSAFVENLLSILQAPSS
jgi:DNA-binding NarL/FixJ family response regulator